MSRIISRSLVVLAFLFTACAPTIRVNVLKPASVNLGSSKQLSLLETSGRRSAREFVIAEVTKQARATGYFTVSDRTEEGISVKVAGRSVNVTGGTNGQKPDELGMKIEVLEWSSDSETLPEKRDDKGNITQKEKRVYKGKVLLGVTVFDSKLRAPLAETEFQGTPVNADTEEEAQRVAASGAVHKLLAAITPTYQAQEIRMDGDDEGQKSIIEVAKNGNLDRAATELKAYLDKNAKNPAALYNMAVLLDAQGQYQPALDLYTQAISLSAKEYYTEMKGKCAQRLADQQALAQ